MRAVVAHAFGSPADLSVEEMDPPVPRRDEVVIDVRAAGVNYPDLLVVDGSYQNLPPLPFTPGKEVAGTVTRTGSDVTRPRVGDRVLAQMEYGGYREVASAPAAACVALPEAMPYPEAAGFGLVHLTAHAALVRRAGLRPGETVLVTGASGAVGTAAVQLAKALGATVIAAARDASGRDGALSYGADHAVRADPGTMRDEVRTLTGGRGADVVLETVGGGVFDASLRCVAWEGRLVVVGFAAGDIPTVRVGYLLVKNIGLLGLQVSDYRDRQPEAARAALAQMLEMYQAGLLRVAVSRTYPLEDAPEALARVRTGGLAGRVVLVS
ncbi:MAG: NADPH:quinone oxidoreductase family protein [Streptosporangiaceae bacterium]